MMGRLIFGLGITVEKKENLYTSEQTTWHNQEATLQTDPLHSIKMTDPRVAPDLQHQTSECTGI